MKHRKLPLISGSGLSNNITNTITKSKEIYDYKLNELKDKQKKLYIKIANFIEKSMLITNKENFNTNLLTTSIILIFNTEKEKDVYLEIFNKDNKKNSTYSQIIQMIFPFLKRNNSYYHTYYDINAIPRALSNCTIERAPEPSDILWENYEYDEFYRKKNRIYSWYICTFLVILTFGTVLSINYIQLKYNLKKNKFYSILISIVISSFNSLINKKLFDLTK